MTRVNNNFVHNTYVDRNVMNKDVNHNRAAFNGPNGVKAEANAEQRAAAANAKKMPPTSQQLKRQEAASQDKNLQAKANKGHPNNEAIRSFDKTEGQGRGPGAEGHGLAGEKGEHKTGNMAEHHGQGAGNAEAHGNRQNIEGSKAKAGSGKAKKHSAGGHHETTHRAGQPKMAAHGPKMGGKHPQAGGNRGPATGQQKGKKKSGKPEKQPGHR